MRRIALIATLLALGPASAAAAAPKPNLLVIMTDDQRADTLAVMPETRRRIAAQGTTFVQAHATTPKCCPSRASFFTGLYPHNHGVISNTTADRLDHTRTVQRLVKRRGYRTGIFGKIFNRWPIEVAPPYFDEWAVTSGGYEYAYWNIDGRVRQKRTYSTDLIADRTVRFVRRAERARDEQPWLAWVTPYAPHLPSTPPRRDRFAPLPPFASTAAMSESDWSDKPSFLDRARGYQTGIDTMREDGRRSLIAVDRLVARVLDELRAHGEDENTLVVFTSDNGFLLGEHGGLAHKDLPYPPATQIPLLVRWPGEVRAGHESRRPVTNVDVAATLLEAAGVSRTTDGRSLFSRERRSALFMEHHGGYNGEPDALPLPPWASLLTRSFRYAEYYENGTVIAREYYDHTIDPWELENRVAELSAARVAELSARLSTLASCRGRACP